MTELEIPEDLLPYAYDTSEAHQRQIRQMHENDFRDHVIVEESPGVFLCKRPGTTLYSFRVVFLPGCILVYGDIGHMILRPGHNRGIEWLRDALHGGTTQHFGYLFDKVPHPHKHTEFMPGDVIEACKESYRDGCYQREIRDALDNWECTSDPSQAELWYDAASAAGLDCEFYADFSDYSSEMYWCAYALCWFVKNYKETP